MTKNIPQPVTTILTTLEKNNFEAFVVGGSVRDMLLGKQPKDWDVATNAKPEEVQELFVDSFCENDFGTVGVKTEPFLSHGKEGREHDVVEVTTYRIESSYSDSRHPDKISFAQTLSEDLARRDFTINAIALSGKGKIEDPFGGQKDLEKKMLRTVGDPHQRFSEDALRLMRAVRLSSELDFDIEQKTFNAIKKNAHLLKNIALERIRDEFSRIVMSAHAKKGIELLHDTNLLAHIIPELEEGIGVEQNHHHIYTVWEHNLRALQTCPSQKLSVRLATLLHDVAKPHTKRGKGRDCTFYNHDHVGARMTKKILGRLKYPSKMIAHAALLVDHHMFYYNVGEVTEKSVRRLVKKVGRENIKDLLDLRIGDRLGSGTPKAKPYKLRHFEYMVDKVSNDPISVKMLKLNGDIMIKDLGFSPGPIIGAVLDVLLSEVIDDPKKNTRENLSERAKKLKDEKIHTLRKMAKERIEEEKTKDDQKMKSKHWVK